MKINYQDIWNRLNKSLEKFDEVIAAIGEEVLPAKNEYDENVLETKLIIPDESFSALQDIFTELEQINSDIIKTITKDE